MSDILQLSRNAELAFASYAKLRPSDTALPTNIDALAGPTGIGMSPTQATEFAKSFPTVVASYNDLPGTGFQATVFKDTAGTGTPGNLTLAIRGTEYSGGDFVPTDTDILAGGAAYDQIVAMVNWWNRASAAPGAMVNQFQLVEVPNSQIPQGAVVLRAGANPDTSYVLAATEEQKAAFSVAEGNISAALAADPDHRVEVVGHSTGGHLAMAFSTIFASTAAGTTVFNAPGFTDSETNQLFFQKLGGAIPAEGAANITNVIADESLSVQTPFSPIAGLHSRPGLPVNIAIENQWNSDEPAPFLPALNHSIVDLTDSLAVFNLLGDLDPAFSVTNAASEAKYKTILNLAAQGTAASYERIVDALRALLNIGHDLLPVGNGQRERLYQAIYGDPTNKIVGLVPKISELQLAGQVQIKLLPPDATMLFASASEEGLNGLAYRYALKNLNPFVVQGEATGPLYAQQNENGELDLYDAASGTGTLTQQWLQDRTDFLERKLYINGLDTDKYYQVPSTDPENPLQPPDAQGVAYQQQARLYIDLASGYVASSGPNPDALQNHIFGTDAADVVYAPVSGREDWLYGGGGDDVLAGYYANDYLEGGTGLDTYQFFSGDAADTVLDVDGEGILVRNGAALALGVKVSADVWQLGGTTYTRNGTDLKITFQDTATDSITVRDFDFAAAQAGSYLGIRLADAISLPNGALLLGDKTLVDTDSQAADVQIGYDLWGNELTQDPAVARDDALYGSDAASEHIEGREGNDIIFGDTVQLAAPGPRANPVSSAVGAADFIEGGAGRDIVTAGAGNDWVEGGTDGDILRGNAGNDTLYADTSNGQTLTVGDAINQGNMQGAAPGLQDLLTGDAGDDLLISSTGADYLAGGEGRDVVVGGAGDDTIYGDRSVTNAPLDWSITRTVDVQNNVASYIVTTSSGFSTTEGAGAGDVIYAGAGNDWVFAGGGDDFVDTGSGLDVVLGEAGNDTIFGGADRDILDGDSADANANGSYGDDYVDGGGGNDILFGGKGNDILIGGQGEDQLQGGDGDDVLYGGTETDVLQGGSGKDTYVYLRGDGYDIVNDPDIAKDSPYLSMVVLGPGITKADVKFRLGSLVIDLGGGDALEFLGFSVEDPLSTPMLEGIQFADGGLMTFEDILAQGFDIDGTEGDDALFGTPYTDRIDAKGGDDTVTGRAGDDTILGGAGDDWIEADDGNDVVDGGEGSDQIAGGWGDDTLQGGDGNDAIAGEGGNDALDGGADNDSFVGGIGDDTLNGGTGDDLLIGNEGSDTYTFTAGDGNDLIDEQALIALGIADEAGVDVVRFDATVTQAQVTLSRGGNGDLTIRYGATDAITVVGQYTGAAQAIERIEFDDGSFIDKAALNALPIAPIEGTAGDDTLSGTPGNDTIAGGAGADSYAMYLGMGRDTLIDDSPSGETGTLALAEGLSLNALKARQVGDDLAVDIRGTSEGVIIQGYFAPGAAQDWQIAEYGGAVTTMQDLIDRPDPYADDVALGAREDFRQALLSDWATETVSPVLPTYAYVFDAWTQTTFHYLGGVDIGGVVLQPYTEVLPRVITFFVNGYGIRDGASFVGAPLVHHSIDVLATSQSSDDAVITAQSQSQSSSQNLSYGVTAGKVIPGYGYQSESSTGTFPTGYNSFNVIESHSAQGWAPITLTPGGGAGYAATLNIQEIAEIRTVEDITGGASDNVIYGAAGVSAGHVALIDAGEGDDTVYAGPDDYAYGNEGDDTIYGGALVYGGNGADTLDGGAVQYGGAGDDTLTGGTFMAGGSGDDAMTGVEGATTFYIDPSEVGADVVQDVAGIGIEDLESWYYESIGVEGASEGDAGLWAVVGPSLDSLDSLYWDQQAYPGYESQAKAALKSNGEELAAFFYLTLDDLRADLAVVGAPYRPEDVRYLLPFETLTAHDYQALGRFYDAGLIDTDSVTFGAGVAPADLTLNWNYVDVLDPLSGQPVPHAALEVSWGAASSVSVAIPRSRDLIGTGAEQFRFADGTVLSMADMIALAPPLPSLDPAIPVNGTAADDLMLGSDDSERFDGLSGDDTIIARGGDDVLVGGDGADSLSGGPGADRYVYEAAEIGIDHIDDTGTSGEAYLDSYYQARGLENWKLRPEYTQGGRYRIYVSIQYGYQYFDTFEDAADAAASMIDPPPVHFVEPATVVAPLVFRDDPAALQELIAAGVLDRDVVTFGEGLSLQDLAITVTVFGPDADLHPEEPWYGGGTLSVRWNDGLAGFDVDVPDASYGFTGTSLASRQWEDYRLGEGIEAFEFSDGSTYGLEEILQRANLFLRYGYLFERGSDPQVIEGEWTGVDFAPNIVPTDLYTYRNGADLAFGVIADSAFATIPDWYADPAAVPQWEFRFADGTVYDTDTVTRLGLTQFGSEFGDSLVADPDFASALYGLEGSDVLFGGGGNDLLNGGPGYDYLYGQGGNDIYVFGADSDVDVVSERLLDGGQNGTDSVRFAADVDTTDVVADRDYDSLILNVASTGAQLLLDGWFSELGGLIENFEFADGTVWHAADVEALLPAQVATAGDDFLLGLSGDDVLDGLEGDDTIYGFGGNDTLRGGPGYDYLGGFAGDDTYEFGLGDGVDEIWDRSGTNVLRFDAGIDPESVMVTRDNDDYLYLIVGQGGDRVAIQSWFFAPQPQIAQVIFADGTTWSPAELESRITLVPATEFDDILWGTEGADVLNGLAGDDLIYGNGGNDVLLGGDGFDEIEGGDGDDILDGGQGDDEVDDWTGGHNLLQGGEGDDVLDHAAGRALLIGGLGDDEIDLDAGSSVVAYNPGDGMDTIYAFEQFTLSIGAGVTPSDLSLSPDGDDVIIKVAGVDSIRLTRDGGDTWPLVLLQLFGSVDIYNLTSTISTFENALAADPGLTEFQLGDALPNDLILSSDTGAVGGALAYRYAMTGSLAGLTNSQIFSVLQDSNFGTNLQDIIVVGGDSAPILDIPLADQSANEDAAFSFAVPATTFSDPDADELTYAATLDDGSALPAWLTFDAPTQTFSGIPLQADVGAIDLKVTATDPGGLSAEDSFTVTIANVNDAPVVSATDGELLLGDSAAAVTLFSVFDEDGQTPTQYELYDDVEGGGYFSVNGMQKAAGIAIPVSATDLADTDYVAGATPGTERVWARAYDGEAWSAWQSWTMTSALHIPDAAPDAMPAAATQTVLLDESVAASSLFS
ncbi:MAG: calcium-binding protein, partial [Gemmatimonadaceae bacterium]